MEHYGGFMTDRIFDILMEVKDKQSEMAGDIKAIKQHLKDMNGSVQSQRELCRNTREIMYNKINNANLKIAMASGGLGGIMFILAVLTYFGII